MAFLVWRGCLLPLSGECLPKQVKAYCLSYCKLDLSWHYNVSCGGKNLQFFGGRSFHFWHFHAKFFPTRIWLISVEFSLGLGWSSNSLTVSHGWQHLLSPQNHTCQSATFKFCVVSPNNIHVPAFFLFNLKWNVNEVHWDGETISKIKHLLIKSAWKNRAISFYDEITIWCWKELQSWTAVSGKPELSFVWCWYLLS